MQDLTKKTDEELVELVQSGDTLAMEEILLRYNRAVRARARQFFVSGGDTEDLVQEGMMGLFFAARAYKKEMGKSFKNFAYLCMTRHIYDEISKMRTKKNAVLTESVPLFDQYVLEMLDESSSPEESVIDSEAHAEFEIKLTKLLSDFEYRVLRMYMLGMTYVQICEATNKPFKSVDNALFRAKKKLSELKK